MILLSVVLKLYPPTIQRELSWEYDRRVWCYRTWKRGQVIWFHHHVPHSFIIWNTAVSTWETQKIKFNCVRTMQSKAGNDWIMELTRVLPVGMEQPLRWPWSLLSFFSLPISEITRNLTCREKNREINKIKNEINVFFITLYLRRTWYTILHVEQNTSTRHSTRTNFFNCFLNLNCQEPTDYNLILKSTARWCQIEHLNSIITPHLKSLHWLKITQRTIQNYLSDIHFTAIKTAIFIRRSS